MEIILNQSKETKNKIVYQAVDPTSPIQTIYLEKSFAIHNELEITLTIEIKGPK